MRACRVLLLLLLMSFRVAADEVTRVIPEGKTANYLKLLLKRPRPGYLFDRFLNSWLESGDLRSLELYLETSDEDMAPALLAFYNEAIGEPARASALYEELIEADPEWEDLLYYKAVVDAEAGAYDSAVEGLEALLKKEPAEELELKSLKLLGRALLRSNRETEGLVAWERLLTASQMDPDVAEELLEMQLAEGLYEEALANCDRVLKATKDPYREVMLRMRRASILVRMERRDDAVAGLREAFELTGEGSWLRRDVISRIETLYRGGDDLPGLRTCLDDMLNEWPNNPTLLKASAETARSSGREDEAIESARELVRIMPDARETKDWYVELLLEMGRYEEAIATIEGFVDRYPDDNTLRARLVDVNHRAGDDEQAVVWAMEYLEQSEQTEADYLDVARRLARYDLNNEATSVYLEMLEKWPNSAVGREAVATHMSRESYLHLNLAWKHYEWLAKECDSETLTRLSSVLLAANSPPKARDLLLSRRADFSGDYRYLTALFEATSAMNEPEGLLELGAERVASASTIEELELATAALVYEIRKNKAMEEWIEKLSAEPDSATNDFWLLVALHVATKDAAAADQLIVEALEDAPNDETLLRGRLSLAKRTRDFETAETVLIQLIEANPTRRAIWIRELVPVLTRDGRTDEALKWIETWKTASPNATRPYELERDALLAANRPNEAIEVMRAATRRFDESTELKLALGRLYESRSRTADAQRLYWRLLNAEETLDGRLARLGDLIRVYQNSNVNKLIRELEIRAENAPSSPFPLLGLAECYRVNHRATERAEVLERVLELRPNDVTVLRAKAALEEDLGDYVAARELMLRVAELDPASGAYAKLVEFEALYGDTVLASSMMEDPRIADDPDAFVSLASRLIRVGCFGAVAEPLAHLAAERPADYRLAFLLGCQLQEMGRPSAAAKVFIPLLNMENERPGAGAGSGWSAFAPVNPYQARSSMEPQRKQAVANWRIQYGTWISDDLLEAYSRTIYSVRNMNYYRGRSVPRSVSVPDSLEELEPSVLVKLGELMPVVPEEERLELAACLDEGMPYVGLTTLQFPQGVHSVEWWSAAEERYPGDEQIRLLRALMASHTIQSEEELKEMITSFADDYPELALNMMSSSAHRFPDVMSMLPEIAENVGITEDNLALLTQFSVRALSTIPSTNDAYQAVIELFENVEERNLESDELDANTRLTLSIARARLDDDYTGLLDRAEETFCNPPDNTHYMIYGNPGVTHAAWRQQHQIVFPPHWLPTANASATHLLNAHGGNGNELLKEQLMNRPADSLYRWLALSRMGADPETLREAAAAVAAKEPKTQDERFALACWYSTSNEVERAVGCLLEARANETAGKDMRAAWDRDILTLLSRLDEIPANQREELLAMKKELKTSVLWSDRSCRILLVDFLERLDIPLDEIARQFTLSMGASASRSSRGGSSRRTVRRPPDFNAQIRTMIDQQQDVEAALTRVAVLTRSEALRAIHPSGGQQNRNHWQLVNCLQYIKERDFAERFLALFTPADREPTPREIFERAFALEMLGRNAEALEGYRAAYELRPDWAGARSRYCMGLAGTDPAKVLEILNALSASRRLAFAETYQQRVNDSNISFEDRIGMTELLLKMMEADTTLDDQVLQRILNAVENGAGNQWTQNKRGGGRASLPSWNHASEKGALGEGWSPPEKELTGERAYWKDDELMALQRRRREARLKILQLGATHLSNQGEFYFGRWTAYLDFTGAPIDEETLFATARITLSDAASGHHYFNSGEQGTRREALEVYVNELRRRDDWSDADALMKEMNPGLLKRGLNTLMELNHAETDDAYVQRLETTLKELSSWSNGQSSWARLIFEYHVTDNRPGNIESMLWNVIAEKIKLSDYRGAAQLAAAWAASASPSDVYVRLFEMLFTPAERAIIAEAAPGSLDHINQQTIYMKYQGVSGAFNGLNPPPESLSRLLAAVEPIERKMRQQYIVSNIINRMSNRASDMAWLEGMGFLGTWEEFPFYAFSRGSQSLMARVCDRLNGDTGKAVAASIGEQEPSRFGGSVMTALAANNAWSQRLSELIVALSDYSERLDADPENRDLIFEWIMTMKSYRNATIELKSPTAAAEEVFAEYSARESGFAVEQTAELLTMGLSDYMRDSHNMQQRVQRVISPLVEKDPDAARALFDRSRRMLRLTYAAQGNRNYDDRQVMQQIFQRPTYALGEARFVVSIVQDMDSDPAYKWLSENYVRQLRQNLEQKNRNGGMDSRSARLAAGKESLEILLPLGDALAAETVLECITRVDQADRIALKEWLAEQAFPTSAARTLSEAYLDPKNTDSEELIAFFRNEEQPARSRLSAYSTLNNLGNNKPAALNDPELLFGLVDLLDGDASVRLPREPFKELIKRVLAMEDGEEKSEWIGRLLNIWRTERVDGAPSYAQTIHRLIELTTANGLDDDARLLLATPMIRLSPKTYAVALQHGYYDFVEQRLPGALNVSNSHFPMNEVWIPTNAVEWMEGYVAGIEDERMKAFSAAYLAAFPVRSAEKTKLNEENWKLRYEEAVSMVNDRDMAQWLFRLRNHGGVKIETKALYSKYVEIVDFMTVIQGGNTDVEAYIAYFDSLEQQGDWDQLEHVLDEVAKSATRDSYNGHWRKKGIQHLLACCLRTTDEALEEKAWSTALMLEQLLDANATMANARRSMGVLSFDVSGMGWGNLEPVRRLSAYREHDDATLQLFEKELKKRWDRHIAAGTPQPDARFLARVELIEELLEEAGPHGFIPMHKSMYWWFGIHYSTPQETAALITYLHGIEEDSLMLAQLKASVSLLHLNRYSKRIPDRRAEDIEAYLARPDLDDVEKVRFVSFAREEPRSPSLTAMKNHLPTLLALKRNPPLMREHLNDFLWAFPVPANKKEFECYEVFIQQLQGVIVSDLFGSPDEKSRREFAGRLVRILIAMDRQAAAEKVLDRFSKPNLDPELFVMALEGGAVEWCERALSPLRALPAAERIAAYRAFDEGISSLWKTRRIGANASSLKLWISPAWNEFVPIHSTLKNYVWTPELVRYFEGKDATLRVVAQAKASISAHGLARGGSRSLEERTHDIEHYLTRADLDDVEIIDFAVANSTVSIVGLMSPASRRAVIDALQRKPELVERYGLAVLRVARGSIESKDRALFDQCADGVMKEFERMNVDQKGNAHTLDQITELLPTLRALGREEDIDRILNEEKLYPARHPNLFRVAVDLGKVDWCLERLEGWLAMHVRACAVGPDVITAPARVRALLSRIEDPDLRFAAEIFFTATIVGEKSPEDFKELAARFNEHAFSNAVWLAVSRDALEKAGALAPAVPAPLLEEWAKRQVVVKLSEGTTGYSIPEQIAFEVYLLSLLNEGRVEEVISIYKKVAASPSDANGVDWLCDIPTRDDLEICEALLRGERVELAPRYANVDVQDRYRLQLLLERISREKKVGRTLINSHVSPAVFALARQAEEFKGQWNVASRRFDLLFSSYLLYSGALVGEPDEERLQELIEGFRDAVLVYKDQSPGGFFGRYDFSNAAKFIPKTYPYSLDAETWSAIADEVLPLGELKLPPRVETKKK